MLKKIINAMRLLYPSFPLDGRASSRLKRGLINYSEVSSWWGLPLLQQRIKHSRFEFRNRDKRHSYKFKVSGGDLSHLWAADEIFQLHVYDLSLVDFTPCIILDLGANIGLFSVLAAKRWPRATLIAVEPHPETFEFLCENMKVNRVNATKIQAAIASNTRLGYMTGEIAIGQHLSAVGPANAQTLTLKLDTLLPADADNLLIKMDIEGSEVEVLNNLRYSLPQNCFIFIEVHDGQSSVEWITSWGQDNGFTFHIIRKHDIYVDGYLARKEE